MAKYNTYGEQHLKKHVDDVVIEAIDLGLTPSEIDKMVEESIAWAVQELREEEFEPV
jgi:hypothetical protein